MVQVLDPLHSGQARGSYSGITHSDSSGRHTVRLRVAPSQPRTARQTNIRAMLTTAAQAWANLDAAERAGWEAYALAHPTTDPFGKTIYLTGINWFVECTVRLLDMGEAQVDTAPLTSAPALPTTFAAANGVLQSVITWDPTAGTNLTCEVYGVGPHSVGRQGRRERAVFIKREHGETGTMTITGLSAGRWTFWARLVDEGNGLAGPEVSDTADITAS